MKENEDYKRDMNLSQDAYMSVNMIWEMFVSLLYKRLKRGLKEDVFLL